VVKFDRIIQPGETGRITLSVDLKSPGRFVKRAVVRTNDPQFPNLTLTLKGEIFAAPTGGSGKPAPKATPR